MLGAALVAFSDDYIDDVYFWDDGSQPAAQPVLRDAAETLPSGKEEQQTVKVTFIEDSVTQHSDTIVKAVIRR